ILISLAIILLIVSIFLINERSKHTTFEEALFEWIGEEEIIARIVFTDNRGSAGNRKRAILDSEEEINQLLNSNGFQLALDMELKEGNKSLPTTNYEMDLYLDRESYAGTRAVSVIYGENDLMIGDAYYELSEDEYNYLVRVIADQELESF
ncbi:hypothetical protein, partial [Atopococcus tabaci]|uniref:hypothetical protein n=1 Tax=Atopococcus tabaci TaxID=269774 RepID=UPI000556CD5A